MKYLATACGLALAAAALTASAQAPVNPSKVVAKPAKAGPPKKTPAKPAEPVLAEPDTDQYAAANVAYLGDYACEFDQKLELVPYAQKPGYLEVAWNKQRFLMKPVLSSTGALRLEDVRGRALMIQIANKSMLMDVAAGRRLVDDCVHERQLAFRAAPPVAGSGLGIDPGKSADTPAAPVR